MDDWKLHWHNHVHHGKYDTLISDILEMMEMKEIHIHDYVKTSGIDLYSQDDMGDNSDIQLYVLVITSLWLIGVIKNIIFG